MTDTRPTRLDQLPAPDEVVSRRLLSLLGVTPPVTTTVAPPERERGPVFSEPLDIRLEP